MQRNIPVDIAKGLGIILIVLGHLQGVNGNDPYALEYVRSFVYQFHVPLFFFLSGLFFKEQENWMSFLKKKALRLYLPYVAANIVFLLFDELLRMLSGVTIVPVNEFKHSVKIILGIAMAPMGGATWFLIALLRACIVYKLLHLLFKGNKIMLLLTCLAIGCGGMFVTAAYSLSASCIAIAFFCIGHLSKDFVLNLQKYRPGQLLCVLIACMTILFVLLPFNSVDVSKGLYQTKLLAPIGMVSGIALTLSFSAIIAPVKRLSALFSFYGRYTMDVLLGHFVAFKLVVILQVIALLLPVSSILAHPCYDVSKMWWLLYLAIALVIPCFRLIPKFAKDC